MLIYYLGLTDKIAIAISEPINETQAINAQLNFWSLVNWLNLSNNFSFLDLE